MAKKPKMLKTCPECGEDSLSTQWCKDRMLQQYCTMGRAERSDCWWKGEPYTPPKKPIKATKMVDVDHGSWEFQLFDQFGHTAMHSASYPSEKACLAAAREEVERHSALPHYGECVAIIWPKKVKVRGTIVRRPPWKRKK